MTNRHPSHSDDDPTPMKEHAAAAPAPPAPAAPTTDTAAPAPPETDATLRKQIAALKEQIAHLNPATEAQALNEAVAKKLELELKLSATLRPKP